VEDTDEAMTSDGTRITIFIVFSRFFVGLMIRTTSLPVDSCKDFVLKLLSHVSLTKAHCCSSALPARD
jgi:hypothetical protein